MQSFRFIEQAISETLNLESCQFNWTTISGGDTHSNFRLELWPNNGQPRTHKFFVKTNKSAFSKVLKSEYDSLGIMQNLSENEHDLNYPIPILFDRDSEYCFLVMEYQELQPLNGRSAAELGVQLAKQHRLSAANFGWKSDNFIGLSEQSNSWRTSWVEFYRLERIQPQLRRAIRNDLHPAVANRINMLIENLHTYFDSYQPQASLLHGDLWSGNVAQMGSTNAPVLFDPAPYYGDREADIAMSELFGRFQPEFYLGYNKVWQLDKGYGQRKYIYNLYHALNHFNLFGAAYASLVAQQLDGLAT